MTSAIPQIAIIGGAGHVGLPLAITFASRGQHVLIHDVNAKALEKIRAGHMPFMDKGAEPLLKKALAQGRLSTTTQLSSLRKVPVIIITIGTPIDSFLNPSIDDIVGCLDSLSPYLSKSQTLILRSTVFPGVTEWLDRHLRDKGIRVNMAFCPERVVQGRAIEEIYDLPQIISGTTPEAEKIAARVFRLCAPEVVPMKPMEAEFTKLFNNAYRYIQFAVANQFFMMAHTAGVDYYRILAGMKKDYPRAHDIPGAGFAAGPCLFKDTMQLVSYSGNRHSMGHYAMLINEGLPFYVVEQIAKRYDLKTCTIGLLGMAFKANIDDARASLSYKLKKVLKFKAKNVLTTDPFVQGDSELQPLQAVLKKSDVLILCTPHAAYKKIRGPHGEIFDPWNFLGKGFQIPASRAR